ncbi:hypothetical protein [Rhizobium sp. BK379]|uniref:hypothetical protein n=1 Tax=Rhizobium sp. BK379 TaxID=2587059 RepID=UPI0016121EAB|nr:hypothetical protein [Rhizobium sp. BK379]MBB3444226.1 hypothetical protein [Rhizobium sp. BK379]
MSRNWYVESYAVDGTAADTAKTYDSYGEAFDAVKAICDAGKIARVRAPLNATGEQISSFESLGAVEAS